MFKRKCKIITALSFIMLLCGCLETTDLGTESTVAKMTTEAMTEEATTTIEQKADTNKRLKVGDTLSITTTAGDNVEITITGIGTEWFDNSILRETRDTNDPIIDDTEIYISCSFRNIGDQRSEVGTNWFEFYADNRSVDKDYKNSTDNDLISKDRIADKKIYSYINPDNYSVIEVEIAGMAYVLKDNNGSEIQGDSSGSDSTVSEQCDYILPDSDTILLTNADIENLPLQLINYAKNEIYARHGRKFKSQELQDYFNSTSWYVGTIDPSDFDESSLSKIERDNIKFLQDAEFAMDPNGYVLDKGTSKGFDELWFRDFTYFVELGGHNYIEIITYDDNDGFDFAINGVTLDYMYTSKYSYDSQWNAYIYIGDNITIGYRPDENKILVLSGDYTGEYAATPNN